MVERLRYFQRAHSDIAHLRVAFFEAYLESRSLYPKAERLTDGRITVFAKCFNVSLSAEIGLALFISQLLNSDNFKKMMPSQVQDKDKRHIQDEFQQFLKIAMVNHFFASLDSSFQTFSKVADPDFSTKDKGFKQIYQHTLKTLALQRYIPVVELLRLTRNTMHTNGYHLEKDQSVYYNDKTYEFIKGKPISFLTWSFIAVFMYDIREMLREIIKAKSFAEAARIDDPFVAQEWPATLD